MNSTWNILDFLFLMSHALIVPCHLFEQTGLAKLSKVFRVAVHNVNFEVPRSFLFYVVCFCSQNRDVTN